MLNGNLTMTGLVNKVKKEIDYSKSNKHLRPMISFTFDDGWESDYTIVDPMLRENGIRGTFFTVADRSAEAGNIVPSTTDAQIKEIADNGHEVGSHTLTHQYLTQLTEQEALNEMLNSKKTLQDITGKPVKTLCFPYGDTNERITNLAGGIYEGARGTDKGTLKAPFDPFTASAKVDISNVMLYGRRDIYNTPVVGIDHVNPATTIQFIDYFLSLPEPAYLIFMTHRVYKDEDTSKPSNRLNESGFRQIVEHVSGLKQQGLVDAIPYIEGIRRIHSGQSMFLDNY